ncbi:hypothetical protein FKM82_020025 [Ascaphus truei]
MMKRIRQAAAHTAAHRRRAGCISLAKQHLVIITGSLSISASDHRSHPPASFLQAPE